MDHWKEPEALSPESAQPFPLQLPPQTPEQARELHANAVRRQIHAEAMRENPQGPFRLLGSGLFQNMTRGHFAAGALGILTGAAIGYLVGNMAPWAKVKARVRGRGKKAKENFRGRVEDYEGGDDDDLDPSTWEDDGDDGDEDDQGPSEKKSSKRK